MRLKPTDLQSQLARTLLPIYLISGDEPLQVGEAADLLRAAARAKGYTGREVLEVNAQFKWSRLAEEASALSLFAERRILDLRIPGGKLGNDGGAALAAYTERPADDTILLITMPKLDKAQTTAKWFQAVDRIGAVVQIWPIGINDLPAWIGQRMRSRGLSCDAEATRLLADRVEGNLLAAAQEVEKLLLYRGPGPVTTAEMAAAVADSARYDVFQLVDAALEGNLSRALRILDGLHGEGIAEVLVLWALAREVRMLAAVAADIEGGRSAQQAVGARRDVWSTRAPLVAKGVQRLRVAAWRELLTLCARADRAIKGRDSADPWLLFQDVVARMAGARALA